MLLIIVLSATLTGFYWGLTRYFALPKEGAILILAPVALLASLTAIYSYYLGWVRYRRRTQTAPANRLVKSAGAMLVFVVFMLLQALVAIYFATRNNLGLATLLAITACVTAVWGIVKVRRAGEHLLGTEREIQDDPSWRVFERRFRIFVFGLVLVLPSGLALFSLLALQDLPVTALFAIIAAVIAPWVIRKIRAQN